MSQLAPQNIQQFITAGKATFTVSNTSTGNDLTYKVIAPTVDTEDGGKKMDLDATVRFVKALIGPNNEADYKFIGTLFKRNTDNDDPCWWEFKHSRNSKVGTSSVTFKAFKYLWERVSFDPSTLPVNIEVRHDNHCARCARKLTTPESIDTGFGPICAEKVGISWERDSKPAVITTEEEAAEKAVEYFTEDEKIEVSYQQSIRKPIQFNELSEPTDNSLSAILTRNLKARKSPDYFDCIILLKQNENCTKKGPTDEAIKRARETYPLQIVSQAYITVMTQINEQK